MKWPTKQTPPQEIEEGAISRVAAREEETSSVCSISLSSVADKYPTRHLIGHLDGKGVYAPLHAPSRGLAIEEDGRHLRPMTPHEVARFADQLDRTLSDYLLAAEDLAKRDLIERDIEADQRARESAEDFYERIGHAQAYGGPHVPGVV